MSHEEFSLLSHLGVSVSDAAAPPPAHRPQTAGGCEEYSYRVLAPCLRPPMKGEMVAEVTSPRRVPTAPLADYTGEVLTVKGKRNQPDTEYLIYNARVASIRAVNMQLMETKRRQREEEAISRLSPDDLFIKPHERDDMARRRLLEKLHRINKEQAQRKLEERERERQRRLEREVAELSAIEDAIAKEKTARMRKKQAARESMEQATLEAMTHKREENNTPAAAGGAVVSSSHQSPDCLAFPRDDAPLNTLKQREKCLALMAANRELAEKKKTERQARQMEERMKEEKALEKVRAEIENENRRALEKKQRLREEQRQRASTGAEVKTIPAVFNNTDWFLPTSRENEAAKYERYRELMEANKQLAEEAKRRHAEDAERKKHQERQILRESERAYREKIEQGRTKKREQQEALRNAMLEATALHRAKEKSLYEDDSCFFLFRNDCSKAVRERKRREQSYSEELRKEIELAQAARREAKERETAKEKQFLEKCRMEAKRSLDRKWEKDIERRDNYKKALEEQMTYSKKTGKECQAPLPHRGPQKKILYRCPVTGELLPPELFGIPSTRLRGSGWIV